MPIKAIFLDFYGTLCSGDRDAVHQACTYVVDHVDVGMPPEAFALKWGEIFFGRLEEAQGSRFLCLHDLEIESLRSALFDLHVPESVIHHAVGILKSYWRSPGLHDEVQEALAALSLPLCLVSNADREDVDSALTLHNIGLDEVITSECARSYKPHTAIFEMALGAMNADPNEVIHVGDSLHSDIGGAKAVGIRNVWIEREHRIHDVGSESPDFRISSLLELPKIVSGLE